MSHISQPQDLLKNKNPHSSITFTDGLHGVINLRTMEFVTSPNSETIPQPPLGSTRDLYRREDGFYGDDDPVQHPQPFNQQYRYLSCVPRRPFGPDDPYFEEACMWWEIRDIDIDPTESGERNRRGVLSSRILSDISKAVMRLRERTKAFTEVHADWRRLLSEFDTTASVCLFRLSAVVSPLRDLRRALSEIQRSWRTSVAVMDFVETLEPRMFAVTSSLSLSSSNMNVERRMGAYVWSDKDAMLLFNAALPVYYIRPLQAFDKQNILTSSIAFYTRNLNRNVASPPYPVIYTGQAGSDAKFAAIRTASISCFDTQSPFENMHLPGVYQSSYSLGTGSIISPMTSIPSSSKQASSGAIRNSSGGAASSSRPYPKTRLEKKGKKGGKSLQTGSQVSRDTFADLPYDNDSVPPPIPAWRDANQGIDMWHPGKREMSGVEIPRLKTVLPDPALFFGPSDPQRQQNYFSQWHHIRTPLLERSWEDRGGETPLPQSAGVWRKCLGMQFHGRFNKTEAAGRQARDHQEATQFLQDLFAKYAPALPISPSSQTTLTTQQCRHLIRELSMVNFWYQLMMLDGTVDSTIPQASSTLSEAELNVSLAAHRRGRLSLIGRVLGGKGDPLKLGLALANIGIASETWSSRFRPLQAFWKLMDSWPGEKVVIWNRGMDNNMVNMPAEGEQWERALVQFYVQTYYNVFLYPPILPRRI